MRTYDNLFFRKMLKQYQQQRHGRSTECLRFDFDAGLFQLKSQLETTSTATGAVAISALEVAMFRRTELFQSLCFFAMMMMNRCCEALTPEQMNTVLQDEYAGKFIIGKMIKPASLVS